MDERGKTPGPLEMKPVLMYALRPVWAAWVELHNQRQSGFQVNPITKEAIHLQLDDDGYTDSEEREFVRRLIVRIENRWLELYMEDSESKRKRQELKSKRRNRRRR